jgi:hypothetical protein
MERGGGNHDCGGGNGNGKDGGTDKESRGSPMCGGKRQGGLERMPRREEDDPLQDTQEFGSRWGHPGATMMPAFEIFSSSRILSGAKTSP